MTALITSARPWGSFVRNATEVNSLRNLSGSGTMRKGKSRCMKFQDGVSRVASGLGNRLISDSFLSPTFIIVNPVNGKPTPTDGDKKRGIIEL
jgi:hypothetical protein